MDDWRDGRFKTSLLFLACIFGAALCIESRSVNLALETSFLFDPKDIKENVTFLNNIQNVIDKLKTVLTPNDPVFRQHSDKETSVLTQFLTGIGNSLIKFDDLDMKKFVGDLSEVIEKLAQKNNVFNEIAEDKRLKSFVKNTVKKWTVTDPMTLKVEIAKFVTNDDSNPIVKFFRILNKFFDAADEAKFKKLQKKFEKAKKNQEFAKFLTKTIDFVVLKRYKKLNYILKTILKHELKIFTEYVSDEFKDRIIDDSEGSRRLNPTSVAHVQDFSGSSREEFKISESIEATTNIVKPSVKENEIIINKDLQLAVRRNE